MPPRENQKLITFYEYEDMYDWINADAEQLQISRSGYMRNMTRRHRAWRESGGEEGRPSVGGIPHDFRSALEELRKGLSEDMNEGMQAGFRQLQEAQAHGEKSGWRKWIPF